MYDELNPQKALIFRIVHRDNAGWILSNGMHCSTSDRLDPDYRPIGNPEVIERRRIREVPIPPGGTLSDYIPFYFTPFSPMFYNIFTGHGGVRRVPNEEIVIFVSSLHRLAECGRRFVFTDRHACLRTAGFYNDLEHLDRIPWDRLRNRDFSRDPEDPEAFDRYQAEALVHRYAPVESLLGIVCYDRATVERLRGLVPNRGRDFVICARRGWYFQ